jgi:3-deoxy-D-manno-octulosonate 8-phosphate phosphatase (KDO 8-P phosphatase)
MTKKPSEQALQAIKLFITDVDGVLTDGTLFYDGTGLAHKGFHVQDGMGLKYLQQAGIHVAVITACTSALTRTRMEHLGIEHVFMGEHDKRAAYETLVKKFNLPNEAVAYMGDDIPDLPLIIRAGVGITVADACPALFSHADWITERKGGEKATREVCEAILTAQDHWKGIVNAHTTS